MPVYITARRRLSSPSARGRCYLCSNRQGLASRSQLCPPAHHWHFAMPGRLRTVCVLSSCESATLLWHSSAAVNDKLCTIHGIQAYTIREHTLASSRVPLLPYLPRTPCCLHHKMKHSSHTHMHLSRPHCACMCQQARRFHIPSANHQCSS